MSMFWVIIGYSYELVLVIGIGAPFVSHQRYSFFGAGAPGLHATQELSPHFSFSNSFNSALKLVTDARVLG